MSTFRQSLATVAAVLCAVVIGASTVHATQIMVVDLDDVGVWAAYDVSTGGDDTSGLTGSASLTARNWYETPTYWWHNAAPFFNTAQTATWTVSGYAPGISVKVYAHWRDSGIQGNGDTAASYVVNGGTAVIKNQTVVPVADVTLNDGAEDHTFELIGTYAADGAGQVQVVLTRGNNWTVADAIAFETIPPTPPTVSLPATAQVFETDTLTLTATVDGSPYPALQWKTNGVAVAGATSSTLVYPNIQLSQSGLEWSLEATNPGGSDAATTTVTVVEGTQIMVVDADAGSWATYDESTGAENATGLTGAFASSGMGWAGASALAWNGQHGGFATSGELTDSATWTVSGYVPMTAVKVYVHWHNQGNSTPGMPYIVNGGTPVVKNQLNPPAGDLTLTDPQPVDQPFELVGLYLADSSGQVQVEIGNPSSNFGNVDAVAFQTVSREPFTLIEDFQSHALGADIDTANGWVEFGQNLPAGGSVIQDPVLLEQRAARLTSAASNDGYILDLGANAIPDGSTGTLFFRYRSTGAMSVYLTDADSLHPPNWWTEDEAGIYNNDTAAPYDVRPLWDTGAVGNIDLDTWYNVWVLVDHDADTFSLYMSQEYDPAIGGSSSFTVDTGVTLRGGAAAGDLDHVFMVSNNNTVGGMIDDIYIAQGTNLLIPDDIQPTQGTLFVLK